MTRWNLALHDEKSLRQLVSYAAVGLLSNLAGYLVYLLCTYLGGTPKLTMSVLYAIGAALSFYGNKKLTFKHQGSALQAGARYVAAQCIGYCINLGILLVFVDRLSYPHQLVQAVAIVVVALFLFLALKVFVFSEARTFV